MDELKFEGSSGDGTSGYGTSGYGTSGEGSSGNDGIMLSGLYRLDKDDLNEEYIFHYSSINMISGFYKKNSYGNRCYSLQFKNGYEIERRFKKLSELVKERDKLLKHWNLRV